MKYKCIFCGERKLKQQFHDGELHCSHATCENCGAELNVWFDEQEKTVLLIEEKNGGKIDE